MDPFGLPDTEGEQRKVYSPRELVARKLEAGNLEGVILVCGLVTGVSDIKTDQTRKPAKQIGLGFYLDKKLFCVYSDYQNCERRILQVSAWLDQQRNKEVFVDGHYWNTTFGQYLDVTTFYKDPKFQKNLCLV